MTDRTFGKSLFYAVVTDVNDPDQEGRIRIRIHGLMDDTTNIPDDKLPWIKATQDITSAGHNKIGKSPVGIIPGTIIGGYFMDDDKQYPIFDHVISKAGDPQGGSTNNGQTDLVPGTNSTPIAERNKNNKFVIKGMNGFTNIKDAPTEPKDSDGQDTTAAAIAKTKFATIPTIGSLINPIEHVLQQLTQADPSHLTSVLPNAVEAIMKIKDLNAFSSTSGVNNIVGQMLGTIMNGSSSLTSLISALPISQFGAQAQEIMTTALQFIGQNTTNINSTTVQSIINKNLGLLEQLIQPLVNSKTLTPQALEAILLQLFGLVQQAGQQATIGTNVNSVLSQLQTVLPQIAGAINSTLNIHLPTSVLNIGTVVTALKNFSMSQAFLKHPEQGKKVLAMLATQKGLSSVGALQSLVS